MRSLSLTALLTTLFGAASGAVLGLALTAFHGDYSPHVIFGFALLGGVTCFALRIYWRDPRLLLVEVVLGLFR